MKPSTIGVLLNLGESFTSLGGQAELMLHQNILPYSKGFSRVYVFTYDQEDFVLPSNCRLITPPFKIHRYVYALLLSIIHARVICQCHLLRCFQLAGTLPAIISKLLYGSKFVFNYGYDYITFARLEGKPLQALGFKLLGKIASRLASGIIVKNKNLNIKGYYLPNGVDIELFKPRPRQFSEIPTILYVGRLESQKNLTVLLTALAQVKKRLKIVFVGQGSQQQSLCDQAKQLNLHLTIKLPMSHSQLPAVYGAADIFVLPSLIEGSPKVLLEAMASGLPIVATNVLGIKEILRHHKTGILTPPTVLGLKSGLMKILSYPQLAARLGQAARQEVVKYYNQTQIMAQEIKLLKSCAR